MTTATKLTLLRIVLIPIFLGILYWGFPGADWAALGVFILASLTDMLDGYVARKYGQVSTVGKFLDPLADKVLVCAAMCWLVECHRMWAWVLATVLLREFAVSGLRLIAAERGVVIAAAWSGKVKTFATMVCICFLLVFDWHWLVILCQAVILITTVYSGVEYFLKNKAVFKS